MDDLKFYGKTKHELQSLVHTVCLVSKDIGRKFGMDKCSTEHVKGKFVIWRI